MSLVDEKPRTATATALSDCVLEEITAKDLAEAWHDTPQLVRFLLSGQIARMRTVDAELLALEASLTRSPITKVTLSGVSEAAVAALRDKAFEIARFPLSVGRTATPHEFSIAKNDLVLEDPSCTVSRNHFTLLRCHEDIFVVDWASRTGTVVNGHQLGGVSKTRSVLCDREENQITVGSSGSPFEFRLLIERKKEM